MQSRFSGSFSIHGQKFLLFRGSTIAQSILSLPIMPSA
jgi:hypothetical protein